MNLSGKLLLAVAFLAVGIPALAGQDVLRVIAMPTVQETEDAGNHSGLVIDDDLLREWRRFRDRAIEARATVIVLEVTSPGGFLTVMRQWIDDIEDLRRTGVRTVAFVPRDATSAAAAIALACQELVLAPGAEIGNLIPLQLHDGVAFKEAPAKIKTEVLALMTRIANGGRFHELLLKAMVDPELEIIEVRDRDAPPELMLRADFDRAYPKPDKSIRIRTISSPGAAWKAVAGANTEGLKGFPFVSAASRDDLPEVLGLGDRPLAKEELLRIPAPAGTFWRGIFRDVDWSVILLVLGILFFLLEIKTAGLGLGGIIGILCLIGYFALHAGEGPSFVLTMGLLLLGFFLLLVEIMILPGFGVAGVSGIGLILFSIYAATIGLPGDTFSEQVIPDSTGDWLLVQQWAIRFTGALVLGTGGAFFVARHLHRVPVFRRAFIKVPVLVPPGGGPSAAGAPGAATATGVVKIPLGAEGTAETDLRPAGKVRFFQGVVDVVSDGEWVPAGTSVHVLQVEGNRVVVGPRGGAAS